MIPLPWLQHQVPKYVPRRALPQGRQSPTGCLRRGDAALPDGQRWHGDVGFWQGGHREREATFSSCLLCSLFR